MGVMHQSVELQNVAKSNIEAILSAPKSLLKSIKTCEFTNKDDLKVIMDKLGMNTGAIQDLNISHQRNGHCKQMLSLSS